MSYIKHAAVLEQVKRPASSEGALLKRRHSNNLENVMMFGRLEGKSKGFSKT